MERNTRPFFVMPGSALRDLREELDLLEGANGSETMERYGYRCGVGLVRTLAIECTGVDHLRDVLKQIWSETGLSRMEVDLITENEMVITFADSIEAESGYSCDFTKGYLIGIVSTLMKRRYEGKEVSCISDGSHRCVHVLTPSANFSDEAPKIAYRPDNKHILLDGNAYLMEMDDNSEAYEIFLEQVSHGRKGMIIAREYPEKVKKRYGIDNIPFLWLSFERDRKYTREPTNIPLIYSEVKNFLDTTPKAIVLFSGIEYLISQNTFVKVLKFVQLLNENISITDGVLLLPVSPDALNQKEVKQLERELRNV
ncbi:MAG: V4R domain protein [Methanomassiliicoccales archaeon PtaU1.Bin124]|nr:MAG: V4R domain protein [Methanomassiliicoccales archaeon PtaU1.Bin124]